MDIVGIDRGEWADSHVHTIDMWFSDRRRCWVVERLNEVGDLIGATHCCATLQDAEDCLADWLRGHDEAHLTAARATAVAVRIARDAQPARPQLLSRTAA